MRLFGSSKKKQNSYEESPRSISNDKSPNFAATQKVHPFNSYFDNMNMFHTGGSIDMNKNGHTSDIVPFPHLPDNYDSADLGLDAIGIDDIDICFWTEDLNVFAKDSVFKVVDGIGAGGFGVVLKVCDMSSSQDCYAMKVIPKRKIIDNYDQQLNELNTMAKLENCCPFLQDVYGIYENESNVYIISEYISGGDLFFHLETTKFSSEQLRIILAELFVAIDYMHSQNVLHRDIKIENIMFNRQGRIKLIDYGLSLNICDDIEENMIEAGGVQKMEAMGSLPYMPPELIQQHIGGRFTDWWSYGVVAYELFTGGKSPWKAHQSGSGDEVALAKEILDKTQAIDMLPLSQLGQSGKSSGASIDTDKQSFVSGLLNKEFRQRLGTVSNDDIRYCSYFQRVNMQDISQALHPPLFTPSPDCFLEEDKRQALAAYQRLLDKDSLSSLTELLSVKQRESGSSAHMASKVAKRRSSSFSNQLNIKSVAAPLMQTRRRSYDFTSHSVMPFSQEALDEEEKLVKLIEDIQNCAFGLKAFPEYRSSEQEKK